jgi:hypothetical protein
MALLAQSKSSFGTGAGGRSGGGGGGGMSGGGSDSLEWSRESDPLISNANKEGLSPGTIVPSSVPRRFSLQAATLRPREDDDARRAALRVGLDMACDVGGGGGGGGDGGGGLIPNRFNVGPDSPVTFQL